MSFPVLIDTARDALVGAGNCPRAEVMMSFRTAQDDTLIAQLIGRMVRTPLARLHF